MAITYKNKENTIQHTIAGDGVGIPLLTTVQRNALTSVPIGFEINHEGIREVWSGTSWDPYLRDQDLPDINENQMSVTSNIVSIDSNFDEILPSTSSLTSHLVNFTRSRFHGNETDPIYQMISIARENSIHLNQSVIYHSGIVIPDIFFENRPTHTKYYTDTAQMIADQANQLVDLVYLAGSVFYQYNGVANALITDYTDVSSKSSTGTKPSWLFIEGDEYLVGTVNLNELTATFKKFHKVSSVVYTDVVVLSVLAVPGGNLDTTIPDLSLVLDLPLNENPQDIPNLEDLFFDDNSFYDPYYENGEGVASMVNPENTVVVDLGGGEFAYRTFNASVTASLRPFLRIQQLKVPIKNVFSIVIRLRKFEGDVGTGTLGSNILGSIHMANNSGGVKIFSSSQGTMRMSIGATALNGGQVSANEIRGSDANEAGKISSVEYRTFIFMFDGTDGYMYRNNGTDYVNSGRSNCAGRTAESINPIQIGRNIDGTSNTDLLIQYFRIYNRLLTIPEITALP
jgi:hypothetical protein